eukprot:4985563-Ditylum_brightwellii.AAC.1
MPANPPEDCIPAICTKKGNTIYSSGWDQYSIDSTTTTPSTFADIMTSGKAAATWATSNVL